MLNSPIFISVFASKSNIRWAIQPIYTTAFLYIQKWFNLFDFLYHYIIFLHFALKLQRFGYYIFMKLIIIP